MFAHRSTVLPSSSSANVRSLVSNENVISSTSANKPSSNFSPTPGGGASSTKRRAFGDISNNKSLNSASKSKSGFGSNQNNIVLKKTTFTPRSKLHQHQHKPPVPKSRTNPNSTSIRKPLPSSSSTIAPKSVTKKPSSKVFLPRKTNIETSFGKTSKTVVFESVDDVELPAGRLFSQQHENESDDLTEISEQEFIDNMWSDWRPSARKHYLDECLKIDKEIDQDVQERMNDFFQREEDEMHGIESLMDLVDDLDLDKDLALSDNDDSWSQPASSIFGDDHLDDSLLY